MHLDGFLSQTSTVFCFVGLAWALRLARATPRLAAVAAALLLGFLLSAYSEVYVLGLGLALGLVVTAPGLRRGDKWGLAAFITFVPWGCLSPFAANLAGFIRSQYHAAQHAQALAQWHPRAGTWRGWNELFFAAPNHIPQLLIGAALLGGGLLAIAMLGAVPSAAPGSAQRLLLALFPAAVLVALVGASWPVFPTYAFGKLLVSFSPLAVVLIALASGLPSLRRIRAAAWLLPVLIWFGAWSSWTKLAVVFHDGAGLQTMNLPSARAAYRELDAHPERTYLIIEPHGMLNSWLAYHARE
jgi:hypothetical protein